MPPPTEWGGAGGRCWPDELFLRSVLCLRCALDLLTPCVCVCLSQCIAFSKQNTNSSVDSLMGQLVGGWRDRSGCRENNCPALHIAASGNGGVGDTQQGPK